MFKIFATRMRRRIAVAICAVLAAVLLFGANYLSHWQSSQFGLYNFGIQLYQAGDKPCEPQELADPIGNKCIAVDTDIKVFNASIQTFAQAKNKPDWMQRNLLPPPSLELAAWAAIHEGNLYVFKQKPEEAVKALKLAIVLADVPNPFEGKTAQEQEALRQHPTQAVIDYLSTRAPLKKAIYDLELLFKKNPSQAQKEGKGEGKGKGQQPEPATPDKDPSNQSSKGDRNAI